MLPAPFFGWLAALMFLLLMQFLIKHMPDLVGKGLPLRAVIELIVYSLAYMLVLAVPMSVLIATLMVFGRVAETRAYAVMKSSGVSFFQLTWPAMAVALALAGGMTYFNTIVLPESNFRAKVLWQDIRQKRPGFVLEPGVFYEGVSNYSILVRDIDHSSGRLTDVTVFDYTAGPRMRAEIKAAGGLLETRNGGRNVVLTLEDGELHRLDGEGASTEPTRYERIRFARHVLGFSIDDLQFSRTDPSEGRRSDRTMRTSDMVTLVDSLKASVATSKASLVALAPGFSHDTTGTSPSDLNYLNDQIDTDGPNDFADSAADNAGGPGTAIERRVGTADLGPSAARTVYLDAAAAARLNRGEIDNVRRTVVWQEQKISRYAVEIHKKYSIAVACLVFLLVAAPLGLSIRRSSLAMTGAVAMAIFVFYWVTLVFGEKLADRGELSPGVGMWVANVVTLCGAAYLMLYVTLDLQATPPLRRRIKSWLTGRR